MSGNARSQKANCPRTDSADLACRVRSSSQLPGVSLQAVPSRSASRHWRQWRTGDVRRTIVMACSTSPYGRCKILARARYASIDPATRHGTPRKHFNARLADSRLKSPRPKLHLPTVGGGSSGVPSHGQVGQASALLPFGAGHRACQNPRNNPRVVVSSKL